MIKLLILDPNLQNPTLYSGSHYTVCTFYWQTYHDVSYLFLFSSRRVFSVSVCAFLCLTLRTWALCLTMKHKDLVSSPSELNHKKKYAKSQDKKTFPGSRTWRILYKSSHLTFLCHNMSNFCKNIRERIAKCIDTNSGKRHSGRSCGILVSNWSSMWVRCSGQGPKGTFSI